MAVRYPTATGPSEIVPFVGDDSLIPHLWRVLGETSLRVELEFFPPLVAAGETRNALAQRCHRQITGAVCKPVMNLNQNIA